MRFPLSPPPGSRRVPDPQPLRALGKPAAEAVAAGWPVAQRRRPGLRLAQAAVVDHQSAPGADGEGRRPQHRPDQPQLFLADAAPEGMDGLYMCRFNLSRAYSVVAAR